MCFIDHGQEKSHLAVGQGRPTQAVTVNVQAQKMLVWMFHQHNAPQQHMKLPTAWRALSEPPHEVEAKGNGRRHEQDFTIWTAPELIQCTLRSYEGLPCACRSRYYYGLNDWMPQIPEGTGHRSQRDMINSCFHAQWP